MESPNPEEETYDHPDSALGLTIVASDRQRRNRVLDLVKDCRIIYANIVPDFLLSPTTSVVFVTLAYHRLHPDYLPYRVERLKKNYRVRLLLCLVDLEDADVSLAEVTQIAFQGSMSLFLAWSNGEASRILQIFKQWIEKPPDLIQGRLDSANSKDRCMDVLLSVPSVNKVDCVTLMKEFGTVKNLIMAKKEDIAKCQGIGSRKLKQLWKVFHDPIEKPQDLP